MSVLSRRSVLAGMAAAPFAAQRGVAAGADRSRAHERLEMLARGYNLPGVADVPADEARMPSMHLVAHLAALGLTTVRLPVEPALVVGERTHVALVEEVIDRLLTAGTTITIDLHPGVATASLLERSPGEGSALIEAAWERLMPVAKDKPAERVLLELLNEPSLPESRWRSLRARLVSRIRGVMPDHTLVWGAAANQTIEETIADPGPDDSNAIAAVHFYYPMIFTHQGQSWDDGPLAAIRGFPFPFSAQDAAVAEIRAGMVQAGAADSAAAIDAETKRSWTEERIVEHFAPLRAWAAANGWPVVINEFGAFNDYAPVESRARWLRAVRRTAEANGFGWNHWELDGGFGFTSSRSDMAGIDPIILDALLGPLS